MLAIISFAQVTIAWIDIWVVFQNLKIKVRNESYNHVSLSEVLLKIDKVIVFWNSDNSGAIITYVETFLCGDYAQKVFSLFELLQQNYSHSFLSIELLQEYVWINTYVWIQGNTRKVANFKKG